MNAADRLLGEFPWLTKPDLQVLDRKPYLVLYLEEGDEDLIPARARYREAQKEARIELRKKGKEPHKRMIVGGVQTTAFEDPQKEAR